MEEAAENATEYRAAYDGQSTGQETGQSKENCAGPCLAFAQFVGFNLALFILDQDADGAELDILGAFVPLLQRFYRLIGGVLVVEEG